MEKKGILSSNMCAYINCPNNKLTSEGVSFFKFPVKNVEVTKQWQINCGNEEIRRMTIEMLQQKKICEKHFELSDLIVNKKRKLLRPNVSPIKYTNKGTVSSASSASVIGDKESLISFHSFDKSVRTYESSKRKSFLTDKTTATQESYTDVLEIVEIVEHDSTDLLPKIEELDDPIDILCDVDDIKTECVNDDEYEPMDYLIEAEHTSKKLKENSKMSDVTSNESMSDNEYKVDINLQNKHIMTFFKSIGETVLTFKPALASQAKLKVAQLIHELEILNLEEA